MNNTKLEDMKMEIQYLNNYISTVAWAQDFVYALEERPKIFKWIFKLTIGKYAWREFLGMVETLIRSGGYYPNHVGYSCAKQEYHKDHRTLWGLK
jgi:hypothetical protein